MSASSRLVLALTLAAFPVIVEAACLPTKGKPLRTNEDITLDYLMCEHRKQVEALGDKRPAPAVSTDELLNESGAVKDVQTHIDPFAANTATIRRNLNTMSGVNARTGDRFKALVPRRLP